MPGTDGFSLTVTVPADDWAYINRRAAYLEAVLVQVLRDRRRVIEWFDAATLAAMGLPGLPASKAGIARLATVRNWLRRDTLGQGGTRFEYHFTSLPARAFDALVARIVDLPAPDASPIPGPAPALPALPAPEDTGEGNATPPWLLPLLRVIRTYAPATVPDALRALPEELPEGVSCPSLEEATDALRRLGMVS